MAGTGEAPAAEAEERLEVSRVTRVLDPMPKLKATVVHGFGRGSKTLGFPTANMEVKWDSEQTPEMLQPHEQDILRFAQGCEAGIYYAWARVVNGKDDGVYKVAMSVGWNPTFTDVKAKTIEPWILHDYPEDFYGCELRIVICGFVRPEAKFDVFDELIVAIREDGEFCRAALDEPEMAAVRSDPFFSDPGSA